MQEPSSGSPLIQIQIPTLFVDNARHPSFDVKLIKEQSPSTALEPQIAIGVFWDSKSRGDWLDSDSRRST
ncbi:hypothetical protein U1Q18_009569 [Sarracenia purpurea var. burkii]